MSKVGLPAGRNISLPHQLGLIGVQTSPPLWPACLWISRITSTIFFVSRNKQINNEHDLSTTHRLVSGCLHDRFLVNSKETIQLILNFNIYAPESRYHLAAHYKPVPYSSPTIPPVYPMSGFNAHEVGFIGWIFPDSWLSIQVALGAFEFQLQLWERRRSWKQPNKYLRC